MGGGPHIYFFFFFKQRSSRTAVVIMNNNNNNNHQVRQLKLLREYASELELERHHLVQDVIPDMRVEIESLLQHLHIGYEFDCFLKRRKMDAIYSTLAKDNKDIVFAQIKSLREYVKQLEEERDHLVMEAIPDMKKEVDELGQTLHRYRMHQGGAGGGRAGAGGGWTECDNNNMDDKA